jgi:ArsR family transcriptional regulator
VSDATPLERAVAFSEARIDPATADDLGTVFRALGDPHRIRILLFLLRRDPLVGATVNELRAALGLSQPLASYHLKQLLDAGVLKRARVGRFSYYNLPPRTLTAIGSLLDVAGR